jgi:hypothetical protein
MIGRLQVSVYWVLVWASIQSKKAIRLVADRAYLVARCDWNEPLPPGSLLLASSQSLHSTARTVDMQTGRFRPVPI